MMTFRPTILQWPLSLIFICLMYLSMAVLAIVFLPWAVFERRGAFAAVHTVFARRGAFAAVHTYCRWVRVLARWLVGLRSEVRGDVPQGEVMIASKHQSFFDIIIIVSECPRPKFIMKKQLVWAPILGWFALRIGCIPVDRGKRGAAIQKMVADVAAGRTKGGQLIIYPQGTRVAPDADKPYKVGTGVLYQDLGQTCVPAATNVGVFWPRHGFYRKPGLAVVEFVGPITPGYSKQAFMERLDTTDPSVSLRRFMATLRLLRSRKSRND
jgi:1-acyl-sn-glycerol-3-phosphate acyltransferase